jgi:hypothetical protein
VDIGQQISLLRDTGIRKDDINVPLLRDYLLEGGCLAFPRRDVALREGQAGGRVFCA